MDRANSYVAGSRHKDNCHWFFNNQELSFLSDHHEIDNIKTLAKAMSTDKRKDMAIEHIKNNGEAGSPKYYEANSSTVYTLQ